MPDIGTVQALVAAALAQPTAALTATVSIPPKHAAQAAHAILATNAAARRPAHLQEPNAAPTETTAKQEIFV